MFMGVVFPPNPEHNFDGKVSIKCISRTRQLLRDTYHCTKFHNDYHINQLLIAGDWCQVYDNETYTANEILALIVDYYELDNDVTQALCIRYHTHQGQQ
jgi:predicted DNA-binding protein (MmcQ/YjbR family)